MKKILSLILAFVLLLNSFPITAFAAAPFSTSAEVFGYSGKTYLVIDEAPLRDSPSSKGKVYEYLPEGYPIEAEGLYRNTKGNLWVKVADSGYGESWIYIKNLEEHSCKFTNLPEFGIEFCFNCGYIRPTQLNSEFVDMEAVKIIIIAASMLPVVGNGFDLLDALICLYERDYAGAALSLASAIPGFGSIGNSIKAGDAFVLDSLGNKVAAEISDDIANSVRLTVKRNPSQFTNSLNDQYLKTGDIRFSKNKDTMMGKFSVAAHHIVALTDAAAEPARQVLRKLDINLNGFENGVYLCMKVDTCIEGAVHVGRHSAEYYELVNKTITEAYHNASPKNRRQAVINALDDIARRLMKDDFPL